ncbi:MAG: branched-chain amino acid transporter AzlC, partial [Bacillota bacterium]|nr:branched-chain amino acid transporter AzlC [Bacillota bacterium]
LEFVMTAMFVVIFMEQYLKEKRHYTALIGMVASIGCLLLFGKDSFMVPTMICILIMLTAFRKPIDKAGGLV